MLREGVGVGVYGDTKSAVSCVRVYGKYGQHIQAEWRLDVNYAIIGFGNSLFLYRAKQVLKKKTVKLHVL